jgi:hypothetical protein
MKTALKNYCLTGMVVCSLGIASLSITSETPQAEADTQIAG